MFNSSIIAFKKRCALVGLLVLATLLCNSCAWKQESKKKEVEESKKPNILWILLEDTSPIMGCYGSSLISTPNIDNLAENGILYKNIFMSAPVCSASRSSIITGTMATTFGLQNHHSSRTVESAIYLPDGVKTIPELFRKAGYFTFNNGKEDYNFIYDRKDLYQQEYKYHPLYGKEGVNIEIPTLKGKQPFFGQIQLYGGKEIFSPKFKEMVKTPMDRSKIVLPPFLPNDPAITEEYANHLDAIQITDRRVGEIINKLKENGLLNNTIVFFFADHGMRMLRYKQFLYDGGLRVPLIIADYSHTNKNIMAGSTNIDLVSGVDLGTSSLALAGIPIPKYMEGRNIFNDSNAPREYIISTRDRCDFSIDRIRSVRSKEFKYIRNFMTDRPYMQRNYMDVDGVEYLKVMRQLHAEKKLNAVQDRFMSNERPAEELYDIKKDPFEINNLAKDPAYAGTLVKYANILDQWITKAGDKGQYPESEPGLKFMLGIWGKNCINPEYDPIRKKYPKLGRSLFYIKSEPWKNVGPDVVGTPLFDVKAERAIDIKVQHTGEKALK